MTDQRPDDGAEWLVTGARGDARRRVLLPLAALFVAITVVVAGGLVYRHASRAVDDPAPVSAPTASATVRPTPTAPATSTASAPRPVVTTLGRRLLGVRGDWELIGYGPGGVVRIEPAKGVITVNRVPGLLSSGPVTATAGRDFVVIRPWDEVQGYLVRDGRAAQPLTGLLASAQTVGAGPDATHVWAATAPRTWSSGEKVRIRLVDAAGRATGSELPVPAGSSGFGGVADGAGNLVIDGTGGTYVSRPGGLTKITAGDLLAVGPTRFLTVDCDQQAVCRTNVTDRRTGVRRSLGVADDRVPDGTGVISPDGRYASVVFQGADGSQAELVDLTTGRRRPIAVDLASYGPQAQTWSPDGRWLFLTDQKTLYAVDPASAAVTAVTEVTTGLQLLTIRNAPTG